MERIKILVDSGADIPKELVEKYDITVLPICIIINGEVFYDGVNLDGREYLEKIKEYEQIPTTSMVPVEMMKDAFIKYSKEYDKLIYVTISSKSSGGYQTAFLVKSQIEEETGNALDLTILDSYAFSMLYGSVVVKMAKLAKNGASYNEVIDCFNKNISNISAYFMVGELGHLQKGGRIKPGVALIGTLLGIKPVLTINDGLVDVYSKERGKRKALDVAVKQVIAEMKNPSESEILIANGYADEDCKLATEMILSKITPKSIMQYDLGCVIGTHTGPGVVGILFTK